VISKLHYTPLSTGGSQLLMNVAHEQIAITCNCDTIKLLKIVPKEDFKQITKVLHT